MRFIGKEEICLTSLLAIGKLHARTDLDIRTSEQVWENFLKPLMIGLSEPEIIYDVASLRF